MKKRIIAIALCLVLVVSFAACGQKSGGESGGGSGEKITLKIAHQTPEDNYYDILSHKFADLVSEYTDGRITIEVFANGTLGYDSDIIQALQFGNVDFGAVTSSPIANFEPAFAVLDLPYLMSDWDEMEKFVDSDVAGELLATLEPTGIQGLGIYANGFRSVTNSKKPIKTPADLKGLKLRVIESTALIKTFEDFGAIPQAMSWGEVYSSIQQGTIDGQENPAYAVLSGSMAEVQKYYSLTQHTASFGCLLASSATLNKLSEEDQEIIYKASEEAIAYMVSYIQSDEQKCMDELKKQGMEINEVDNLEDFKALATSAYSWFESQYDTAFLTKIQDLLK